MRSRPVAGEGLPEEHCHWIDSASMSGCCPTDGRPGLPPAGMKEMEEGWNARGEKLGRHCAGYRRQRPDGKVRLILDPYGGIILRALVTAGGPRWGIEIEIEIEIGLGES